MLAMSMDLLRPRSRGAPKLPTGHQKSTHGLQKHAFGVPRSRASGGRSRSTHRRVGCEGRLAPSCLHPSPLQDASAVLVPVQAAAPAPKPKPSPSMEAKDLLAELGICTSSWVDRLVADAEDPDEASMFCKWDGEDDHDEDVLGTQVERMCNELLAAADMDDTASVASFETEADEDADEAACALQLTDMLKNATFMDMFGTDYALASLVVEPKAAQQIAPAAQTSVLDPVAVSVAESSVEELIIANMERDVLASITMEEGIVDDEFEDTDSEDFVNTMLHVPQREETTVKQEAQVASVAERPSAPTQHTEEKPRMSRHRRSLRAAGACVSAIPNPCASATAMPTVAGRGISAVRGLRQESSSCATAQEDTRARRSQRSISKCRSVVFHCLDAQDDAGCELAPKMYSKKNSLIESYDALGAKFYNMAMDSSDKSSSNAPAQSRSSISAIELDLGLEWSSRPSSGKMTRSSSDAIVSSKRSDASSFGGCKVTRSKSGIKAKSGLAASSIFSSEYAPLKAMRASSATRSSVAF